MNSLRSWNSEESGLDWFEAMTSQNKSTTTDSREVSVAERLKIIESKISNVARTSSYQGYRKSSVFTFSDMRTTTPLQSSEASHSLREDLEFELEEYISGEEDQEEESDAIEEDRLTVEATPQIIYTTRTHSQISQFIHEIQMTKYQDIRCVVLGGRKQLCINPQVNHSSNSEARISEMCLQLQQHKSSQEKKPRQHAAISKGISKSSSACEYHCKSSEQYLADLSLSKLHDIEDLVQQGKSLQTCPFYSSRRAVQNAQLICMPYSLIINHEARASVGIQSLKNKVIIFDESHNILEATNSVYSSNLPCAHFDKLSKYLNHYMTRFKAVLGAKNIYYLNIILTIVKNLQIYISKQNMLKERMKMTSVNDFIFSAFLDNINILKVKNYLKSSNLARKIGGFIDHQVLKNQWTEEGYHPGSCCTMIRAFQTFIGSLVNRDDDGRICLIGDSSSVIEIKYVSLNSSLYFTELVREAKSGKLISTIGNC